MTDMNAQQDNPFNYSETPWETRLTDLSGLPGMDGDKPAQYAGLDLRIAQDDSIFDETSLIAREMGENVPQGSLFAYLFRRFGYPNRGWDDNKELANYTLETPKDDMFLRIAPYAGGSPDISFQFMINMDAIQTLRDYPWRHVIAHREAFLDWLERPGNQPHWVKAWITEAAKRGLVFPTPGQPATFRDTIAGLQRLAHLDKEKRVRDERSKWIEKMEAAFNADVPKPKPEYRSMNWLSWSHQDPMKDYVSAAVQSLQDLKRPVWVQDCAITIYGHNTDDKDELMEAESAICAGYPSGDLGNVDPAGFAKLHGMINRLGKGDSRAGIAKATEILEGHIP
jgi:hypothetical protein